MFRLELSTQIEIFSRPESSFLSIYVRHIPPSGELEQMLRLIDPANEMAVAETEVIHTHITGITDALILQGRN